MAYVIVAGVFVGVSYWISPRSLWSAVGPVLGGLIGLLLVGSPPVRRWLARLYAGRWGESPPEH